MALELLRHEQAKNRQERFFRVLTDPRRGGETLRSISESSAIPYNTVRSYAGHHGAETAVMSYSNFLALIEAFPEYAAILQPGGEG